MKPLFTPTPSACLVSLTGAWVLLSASNGWAVEPQPIIVEDLAGKSVNALSTGAAKALVFVFMSVECPICDRYAPELNGLKREFESKGVIIRLVYPNPDETGESIRQHAKQFGEHLEQVRDPRHVLVNAAGAEVTPEAAVFVPGQGFVYCGRIDDRFAKLGVTRPAAREHDLRKVLEAVLEGKPIRTKPSRGIGCSIPPVK